MISFWALFTMFRREYLGRVTRTRHINTQRHFHWFEANRIELRRFNGFVKSRKPFLTDLNSSIAADRRRGFEANVGSCVLIGVNELFNWTLTVDPVMGNDFSGIIWRLAGGSDSSEGKVDRGGNLFGIDWAWRIEYHWRRSARSWNL